MICRAAVKIFDKRQDKVIVIPCHRHCDAFQILHDFGYKRFTDYEEVAQGFLDEHDVFLDRIDAHLHACMCKQLKCDDPSAYTIAELYSEDLW